MKKTIGFLLLVAALSSCSAQYRVQKAQAFFTVSMPGMAMQDEQGNTINPQPIIERFIYIECRFNGKPAIDSVFYNGIFFMPVVEGKEQTATMIGINAATGKPVNLPPKKGNHVWKIDLQQSGDKMLQHEALKKIIIKGKLGKIKFSYALTAETKLTSPDRY